MAEPSPELHCPLCGQPNACAVAVCGSFEVACWCTNANFSAHLLAQVPKALQGKACICAACAAGLKPPADAPSPAHTRA